MPRLTNDSQRTVITGIGMVSPAGLGKEVYWHCLHSGNTAIRPVTLFDTEYLPGHLAGEVPDFKPAELLGQKGLRLLDRSTLLALTASQLALEDARLIPPNKQEAHEVGVVLSSTLGSMASRLGFAVDVLRDGPMSINPAYFPNLVTNSPASQVAIRFGLMGPNSTVASGMTGGIEALGYASDLIVNGKAHTLLVGGVEELCQESYVAFHTLGIGSKANSYQPEGSYPYDQARNGLILGEGCAILVLERLDHAKQRNATIYAEFLGRGTVCDPKASNQYNIWGTGARLAGEFALRDANMNADQIHAVVSGGNGSLIGDIGEARSLRQLFHGYALPVYSFKGSIGELFSASSAFQAATGVLILANGVIPAIVNLSNLDKRCPIACVQQESVKPKLLDTLLLITSSPMQQNASAILKKYSEAVDYFD